ncbi:MAG: hypothetical protein KC506_04015, partial [Nanoarchaeota archaeon]|nr:hypothetical protein [Nanoarchaeota archaeon]
MKVLILILSLNFLAAPKLYSQVEPRFGPEFEMIGNRQFQKAALCGVISPGAVISAIAIYYFVTKGLEEK